MTKADEFRRRLYDAYKHRAHLYYLIFDELRKELGPERAEAIMKRAIRRRGQQLGAKYAAYAPSDLEGLRDAFVKNIPDEGRMFAPEVTRCDADALDILLTQCPLKEAWEEAGLSEEDRAVMCRIAAEIDYGTFTSAGFSFSADSWTPGRDGCCYLHIRPGGTAAGRE